MRAETFASQRRFLWLWTCLFGLAVLAAVYLADHPIGGRNGGTTLGFVYGGIAAAGILYLMWYGVRKRYSYASGSGTLKGWLGAHIWIGVSLALVVPMHAGFKIGWNVHAAPYYLMLATIASGIWGADSYLRMPARMQGRREGTTTRAFLDQIERLSRDIAAIGANVNERGEAFARLASHLDLPIAPSLFRLLFGRPYPAPDRAVTSALIQQLPASERQAGLDLTSLAHRRRQVANQLVEEASVAARMRIWLYVHLPLSFACVVAVLAHVFWVFCYRLTAR